MTTRRKVKAVHRDFMAHVDALIRLDTQNQSRYRAGPGRPSSSTISKRQLELLTESIFARAYSHLEILIEDVFILYCYGKPTISGKNVKSFLAPKNTSHARDMIKSGMNFLDWNTPDIVIKRSDVYLEDMNPMKVAVTTHRAALNDMRKIRNAIAHQSSEARLKFKSVVLSNLRAAPLQELEPGEFLLQSVPSSQNQYFLLYYLNLMKSVANTATG